MSRLTEEQVDAAFEAFASQVKRLSITENLGVIEDHNFLMPMAKHFTGKTLEIAAIGAMPASAAILGGIFTALEFGMYLGHLEAQQEELKRASS